MIKDVPVIDLPKDEYLNISPAGLERLVKNYDSKDPAKNTVWTTDINCELPIMMKREGPGSKQPVTIPEYFKESLINHRYFKALAQKIDGKWKYWTYDEFYYDIRCFANALISIGVPARKAVNIIGFNHPAWYVSFFGAAFANVIPVGVYSTNGPEACKYIIDHSESHLVIVENGEHLQKYLKIWDECPNVKYVLVYSGGLPKGIPEKRKNQVILFSDFLKIGEKVLKDNKDKLINERLEQQKPGHCVTLVYTSGTTGPPKAVMLSHDNYTWLVHSYIKFGYKLELDNTRPEDRRNVSYLPLSHVAAQFAELVAPMGLGFCCYFADPSALQGSIIDTLKEVRPTFVLSVPRIWEKVEEQMKRMAKSNGAAKKKLGDWAKSIGVEGTFAEMQGKPRPFAWDFAKAIVYNNIKKALGMDQAKIITWGAAPLNLQTRTYFASLNIFLINTYGMSENAGPQTFYSPSTGTAPSLKSAGLAIPGTTFWIANPDRDQNGEICFRGRNRFMGYLKDDENTRKTIDDRGYLHSGDLGHVDKDGHLYITGRIKELLVTAGGENVAPILIENEVRNALPELSQCIVIGDNRKYLAILLTLKHVQEKVGFPGKDLDSNTIKDLQARGIKGKTPEELKKDPEFIKYVNSALEVANSKAISRAQTVKKWYLLDRDFSIENEEITPTLKIKRNVITKRYEKEIETMYPPEPKL